MNDSAPTGLGRLQYLAWEAPDATFRARVYAGTRKVWECSHGHVSVEEAWVCARTGHRADGEAFPPEGGRGAPLPGTADVADHAVEGSPEGNGRLRETAPGDR
jgi:hypothetical protein